MTAAEAERERKRQRQNAVVWFVADVADSALVVVAGVGVAAACAAGGAAGGTDSAVVLVAVCAASFELAGSPSVHLIFVVVCGELLSSQSVCTLFGQSSRWRRCSGR